MAKKTAASDAVPAAAEKGPAPDAGKAAGLGGDQPSEGEGGARRGLFPPEFSWPDSLSTDNAACGELVYSIKGSGASHPDLGDLVERETYERFARMNVRSFMFANEMVASYDVKLAEAKREAEAARKEAEKARRRMEGVMAFHERTDKQRQEEAAKEKAEEKAATDRLKAQMGRLQDRLRYLQAVEEPSGLVTQIRGILGVVNIMKERKVDVPQCMIDILDEDLKKYKAQVEAIPEVKLDPEDLD